MNYLPMPPSEIRTSFDIPRTASIVPLGSAGGFSGAMFWQVETPEETFCLRRWPKEHPDREQLEWIHRVMVHAANNGCESVERLQKTSDLVGNATFLMFDGFFWQLSEWMPGAADFLNNPNDERLVHAMQQLARFHMAAAQVSLDFRTSTNIGLRLKQLKSWKENSSGLFDAGPAPSMQKEIAQLIRSLQQLLADKGDSLARRITGALEPFATEVLPIQPVIRDIWHDHLLFTGDKVSGIVDFGAMQMDAVSFDISRLVGSLVGDQPDKWQLAVESYAAIRPLNENERTLIPLLDQSGILLGGANWLNWILIKGRLFDDWQSVGKRIAWISSRLAVTE